MMSSPSRQKGWWSVLKPGIPLREWHVVIPLFFKTTILYKMKKLFTALIVLTLMSCACGCAMVDEKSQIRFTSGEVKTVYALSRYDEVIRYYNTKEDAEKSKNIVTVPIVNVKEITQLSSE